VSTRNVDHWDRISDEWLAARGPRGGVWGAWQLPEDELRILGDVAGKDVLELACGSAGWAMWLAGRGARVVGLDPSARQLEHARELGADFPLVQAFAEDVPLPDASFDVVMSDYGACNWSDPRATIPEIARLLRPGGLAALNLSTPIAYACWDFEHFHDRLVRDYFGLDVVEQPWGVTGYQFPYGTWVRMFRDAGLEIDDLVELRPPAASPGPREWITTQWARRWPAENVWVVRKP